MATRSVLTAQLAALVLSLSLGRVAAVMAGPLEDGQAAFDRMDCPAARQIWRPLAEQGNASAQNKLGITYEFGGDWGCESHDYAEAAKWYRKAADQGNVEAEDELASLFYTGRGVLQDYDEAMKWWRKAANQGSADAQHFLGMMYYNGEGVRRIIPRLRIGFEGQPNRATSKPNQASRSCTTKAKVYRRITCKRTSG